MTVGEQIKSIRNSRKIKQNTLADAAFLSPSSLSKIENNQQRPTLDALINLAVALDVSMDDIVSVEISGRKTTSVAEKIKAEAEKLPLPVQEEFLALLQSLNKENSG